MITITPYESALALLAVLACAALVGCRPSGAERPLVVVASGDTNGWIVPCGCTSNQSGGLPRRATFIERLRRAGRGRAGRRRRRRARNFALRSRQVQGDLAGRDADARRRPQHRRRGGPLRTPTSCAGWPTTSGVPLLSANVRDTAGKLVAEPVRLVSAAGRRLALVGVLAERYATAELQVTSPRQAVIEALAQRCREIRRGDRAGLSAGGRIAAVGRRPARGRRDRGRADRSADRPEADRADAVDLGHEQGQVRRPARCAGLRIGRSLEGEHRRTQRAIRRRSGSEERRRSVSRRVGPQRLRAEPDFVCRSAAVEPAEGLCRGRHGRLQEMPRRRLPAVARIEARGGVEIAEGDRLARRSRVPALPHDRLRLAGRIRVDSGRRLADEIGSTSAARAVMAPRKPTSPTRRCIRRDFARAKDCCTACHDRENSPKFDYDKYWEKIRHGQKAKENVR